MRKGAWVPHSSGTTSALAVGSGPRAAGQPASGGLHTPSRFAGHGCRHGMRGSWGPECRTGGDGDEARALGMESWPPPGPLQPSWTPWVRRSTKVRSCRPAPPARACGPPHCWAPCALESGAGGGRLDRRRSPCPRREGCSDLCCCLEAGAGLCASLRTCSPAEVCAG